MSPGLVEEKTEREGFRVFRIVQIILSSSGETISRELHADITAGQVFTSPPGVDNRNWFI